MTGLVATALALAALVLAALAMLRARTVVHAAALVMGSLLLIAAAMLALSAGFAASLMILVHAGAIVTVMLFIAVSLPVAPGGGQRPQGGPWPILLGMIAALLLLLGLLSGNSGPSTAPAPASAEAVGKLLFGPWAVAVELASLLLLVALLGARGLLRREPPQGPPA
ncbi:NADH-quinone oxidoreductase subunit J [Thermaurantiacus sp.]